jgi:hypothetical protein
MALRLMIASAIVLIALPLVVARADGGNIFWQDGRWHDPATGTVWVNERSVWWHPTENIYMINGQWRTGAGHVWVSGQGWAWPYTPAPTVSAQYLPAQGGVERWRSLVSSVFPAYAVNTALRIMSCESGGNPNATGGAGERGLFQIHPVHHDSTYDPYGNVLAAYRISAGGSNWSAWTCA